MPVNTTPLAIHAYRKLFAGSDRPSQAQVDAFVDYVATKHSWYKHLPLTPPGKTFVVFLDPGAGMQWQVDSDGRQGLRTIEHGEPVFHYSMLPTDEYRSRFGLFNVADDNPQRFSLHSADGSSSAYGTASGVSVDGQRRGLPEQAVQAGRVELTALVHPQATACWLWQRALGVHPGDGEAALARVKCELVWPEETGGAQTIRAIAHALSALPFDEQRKAVAAAIAPEQVRQLSRLRGACERALAFAFEPSSE